MAQASRPSSGSLPPAVLVVGSRNEKKKREIERILGGLPVELKSLADFPDAPEVEEDADSFEGNARKKARVLADALGEWVIADDSGLEVDALGGRPGVRSARYAGDGATDADRCRKLLGELAGVPRERRTARFRCAIALARPGEVVLAAEGCCEGLIAEQPAGSGGFGYGPVFYHPGLGRTFGELSAAEKDGVSHRGRALRLFGQRFRELLDRARAGDRERSMAKRYAAGIDLGGTFIKGGVIDLAGNVIYSTSIETDAASGPSGVLERMARLSRMAVDGAKISWADAACVGVGTPGPLNRAKGIVYTAPNLPGWDDVPVVKTLEEKLGCRVVLENDANAAAYAENWVGAGKGASSMILLTLGTGIGGGIVLEGAVWHGRDDAGGELGHMSINFDGPTCGCGAKGCIEAYASAPATARRALEGIKAGRATSLRKLIDGGAEVTAKAIYEAALAGDAFATETIEATGKLLGIAVANFVNIFNPELVVLFGGLAGAGDMLFEPVRREVKLRALKPGNETVRIVPALLGGNAGIIGAAGCALRTSGISA